MADMDTNAIAQKLKDLDWSSVPVRNREAIEQAITALQRVDPNTPVAGTAVAASADERAAEAEMCEAFARHMGEIWPTALDTKRRIWSLAWGASRASASSANEKGTEGAKAIAYRVLRRNTVSGEWVSDGRHWNDGAPTATLLAETAARSDEWRVEIAYATAQSAEQVAIPKPIYQARQHSDEEARWDDVHEATHSACAAQPQFYETRIVYDAAPQQPARAVASLLAAPIPMLLFCPECGLQHVDAPEPARDGEEAWDNPPHRSHLCRGCGTVWRPADVATVGVASIQTTGQADNWDRFARTVAAGAVRTVTVAEVEKSFLRKLLSFAWELDIMWHRDRNEIRRIKLDVRDGVSMAPPLVEQRVDLIREFVSTARNAISSGGGAGGELATPDQATEAAR